MLAGSTASVLAMADWISCAAASILRAKVNWTLICVVPWEFVELMFCTPAIVENSRSSGVATAAAIVSGLAPGSEAFTWMVG